MSRTGLLALVFGLTIPVCTHAQGLGITFEPAGRLSFGVTDRVPGADVFLFGDATLRLGVESLPLGLEIGTFGLADALDTPHETYAALTWDLALGRISVGVPRPAYDGFAVSALETHFPTLAIARTGSTRSEATFGAMFGNYLPYGASFNGETGDLRFALSVHDASNVDRTIAGFGASYDLGDWTLSGAVEIGWGVDTDVAAKVQAKGTLGQVTGGVGIYVPGTAGGPELIEVFASFAPVERVTLSGVVQAPLDGSSDATVGVSASYAFRPDLGLTAGVVTDAGADPSLSAHLDWSF